MRVRLLFDAEMSMEEIAALAEKIADQPVATIDLEGQTPIGARLMGAKPVGEVPGHGTR